MATIKILQQLSKLADGTYVRPAEDPVTIWAIALLHQEYGVPLDALELELYADFPEGTHQGGRRYQGRADVIVYDDRYIVLGAGWMLPSLWWRRWNQGRNLRARNRRVGLST